MKLIDAEKLIKDIRAYADLKCVNGEIEIANGILKTLSIIENQPTAYDVDEVVNNLESTDKTPLYENEDGEEIIDYLLEESNVIEIVKRGGKDEIN